MIMLKLIEYEEKTIKQNFLVIVFDNDTINKN